MAVVAHGEAWFLSVWQRQIETKTHTHRQRDSTSFLSANDFQCNLLYWLLAASHCSLSRNRALSTTRTRYMAPSKSPPTAAAWHSHEMHTASRALFRWQTRIIMSRRGCLRYFDHRTNTYLVVKKIYYKILQYNTTTTISITRRWV